jgi:tetratricopeptide (TPR) repeat protein
MQPTADTKQTIENFKQAIDSGTFATQEVREQLVQYAMGISNQTAVPAEKRVQLYSFAISEFTKQVEALPTDARLRLQLATALRIGGDLNAAAKELDRAIEFAPKKQALHIERGIVAWQAKRFADARDSFVYAYELDPSFGDVAAYAAAGYLMNGQKTEADELLVKHFGTTLVDNNALLMAHYELKNYAYVVEVWKLRVEKKPDASSRYSLAAAYALAGRHAEAVAEARATMTAFPETAAQGAQFLIQLGASQ